MNPKAVFQVNSSHNSFNEKQRNLFNELDKVNVILPQQDIPESEENQKNLNEKVQHTSFKSLRGKESIFKKPEIPPRKYLNTRRIPDFRMNPHKWTKYTLDDVRDEDMSEKSNKVAALNFLKELENRKSSSEITVLDVASNRITFQKTALIKDDPKTSGDTSSLTFRSSKVVMPEYVVGRKVEKVKKNKTSRAAKVSKLQLTLSHLMTEEEEN